MNLVLRHSKKKGPRITKRIKKMLRKRLDFKAILRYVVTANLILAYFGLGLCLNIPGPTLIDLEKAVNTNIEELSILFTVRSVGFLFGSLFVAVVMDRFNRYILMVIALAVMGVTTSSVPWTVSLIGICSVIAVSGFSMGFIETGSNVICMSLWASRSGPVLQTTHAAYGLGSIIAAIIAEPFLSPTMKPTTHHHQNTTFMANATSLLQHTVFAVHSIARSPLISSHEPSTAVSWTEDIIAFVNNNPVIGAYAIIGTFAIVTAGSFFAVYLVSTSTKIGSLNAEGDGNIPTESDPKPISSKTTLTLVILTSIFLCLQAGMETSLGHFLSTFSVTSDLHLTKSAGSYLTSTYWGSYTVYGLISAIRATKFRSQYCMYFDLVLLLVTNCVMCFLGDSSVLVVWIGTILLGFGNSPVFATAYTFFSEFLAITSKEASVFVAATSLGEMSFPLFTGRLIKQESKVLFYQNAFGTVLCTVVFIATHYVAMRKAKELDITCERVWEETGGREKLKAPKGIYYKHTSAW